MTQTVSHPVEITLPSLLQLDACSSSSALP